MRHELRFSGGTELHLKHLPREVIPMPNKDSSSLELERKRVVLLLQGGGALGAYQVGAYKALEAACQQANNKVEWVGRHLDRRGQRRGYRRSDGRRCGNGARAALGRDLVAPVPAVRL